MSTERFPVEATHIMMFARAIGDPNPAFNDLTGDMVAPPTFTMASWQFVEDHPLRPNPAKPWFGSGREPTGMVRGDSGGPGGAGSGGTGLHAEQSFEYHRPLRPGTVLIPTVRAGETWEKESKRGGRLRFSESITEYRDADTGELIVTARMVGVQTGKPVEQGA